MTTKESISFIDVIIYIYMIRWWYKYIQCMKTKSNFNTYKKLTILTNHKKYSNNSPFIKLTCLSHSLSSHHENMHPFNDS